MFIFYDNIFVGEIITNQGITIDEALKLIGFDEEKFMAENGFDDIDYNCFILAAENPVSGA